MFVILRNGCDRYKFEKPYYTILYHQLKIFNLVTFSFSVTKEYMVSWNLKYCNKDLKKSWKILKKSKKVINVIIDFLFQTVVLIYKNLKLQSQTYLV